MLRRYRHLRLIQLFRFCAATTKMAIAPSSQDGLNGTTAAKTFVTINASTDFAYRSLSIRECDDEPSIRERYRPFLLDKGCNTATDWIDDLELDTVTTMAAENMQRTGERLKVLVLYGSLRPRFGIPSSVFVVVTGPWTCGRISADERRETS